MVQSWQRKIKENPPSAICFLTRTRNFPIITIFDFALLEGMIDRRNCIEFSDLNKGGGRVVAWPTGETRDRATHVHNFRCNSRRANATYLNDHSYTQSQFDCTYTAPRAHEVDGPKNSLKVDRQYTPIMMHELFWSDPLTTFVQKSRHQ